MEPDYGCEERPDNYIAMDKVLLRNENGMEIELEIYYEKGTGLFAVESEAVESGTIYSPYTGELCEEPKL